jgi:hypothetical protein
MFRAYFRATMTDDCTATETNQVGSNDNPGQTDVGQSAQGENIIALVVKSVAKRRSAIATSRSSCTPWKATVCTSSKGATVGAWTSKGAGRCRERVEERETIRLGRAAVIGAETTSVVIEHRAQNVAG